MTTPSARTWAKSRTRRSSRLAIRGVPRERRGDLGGAVVGELDAEQARRAPHDLVELGGLVELQVGGEPEPVAQRAGQQPRAGGGADQRERRDLQRDRGGAGPLADDHVDPEVLHRHVEHLLGRPRHPVDLVDEQHVAVVEPGEDRREVAGVGDRRPARSAAAGSLISAAMIIASVVLPRPGRPGQQHVVGRALAAAGRLEHQGQLLADPLLADDLVEGAGPQRRLDGPLVAVGVGVDGQRPAGSTYASSAASSSDSSAVTPALTPCSASAGPPAAGAATSGSAVCSASGGDRLDGAVGLLGRPAEPDQAGVHLAAPGVLRRHGRGLRCRAAADPGTPIRSLSSRMIRWAPFWPMPGTVVSVLTSSLATARRSSSGRVHRQHRLGQLGPDTAGGLQQLEHLLLVLVEEAEQRQRLLADHHARRQAWPACPIAQRGQGVRRAVQLEADPAHLEDGGAEGRRRRPVPRTNAIIGSLLPGGGHLGDRRVDAGLARRRARCGRSPAPGRRRRRRAWAARRAAAAGVTIAPTCALSARPLPVTAALTSLGVCSATGSPRRAATSSAMPLAWAVPITVLTLCWLNTRSTATASGRCSSIHCLEPGLDLAQPLLVGRSARGAYDAHVDHAQRPADRPLDDADTAPGQPGVDAEHAHAASASRPNTCSDHANRAARIRHGRRRARRLRRPAPP